MNKNSKILWVIHLPVFVVIICWGTLFSEASGSEIINLKAKDSKTNSSDVFSSKFKSTEEKFNLAIADFKVANYQQALSGFIDVLKTGFTSPTLFYNLGVCYYKLQRYYDAQRAFLNITVSKSSLTPLAFYNLSLIAMRQNLFIDAVVYLEQAYSATDDARLKQLVQSALEKNSAILAKKIKQESRPQRWRINFLGSVGFDDNVLLSSSDQVLSASNKKDTFFEILTTSNVKMVQMGKGDIYLRASAYSLNYSDLTAFDQKNFLLGIDYKVKTQNSRYLVNTHFTRAYVSDSAFQRKASVAIQKRSLLNDEIKLRFKLKLSRYDELNSKFEYLAGWQYAFNGQLRFHKTNPQWLFSYNLEINDRQDQITPQFTSFSPARHQIKAASIWTFFNNWEAEINTHYRMSRYNDANELTTGLFVVRSDDRFNIGLRLSTKILNRLELSTEYRYTDNDSTISEYNYASKLFVINLLASF